MARPRSFDYDVALKAIADAFRFEGYAATSLDDLMTATGLKKGSLYKAFGDKREMFVKALDRELETARSQREEAFQNAESPKGAVRTWLYGEVDRIFGDDDRDVAGCLIVNAVVDPAPADPEIGEKLRAAQADLQQAVEAQISLGQRYGEFRMDIEVPKLAAGLISGASGVALGLRLGWSRDRAQEESDILVRLLG